MHGDGITTSVAMGPGLGAPCTLLGSIFSQGAGVATHFAGEGLRL